MGVLNSNLSSKFLVIFANSRKHISKKDNRTFCIYDYEISDLKTSKVAINKDFLEGNVIKLNSEFNSDKNSKNEDTGSDSTSLLL